MSLLNKMIDRGKMRNMQWQWRPFVRWNIISLFTLNQSHLYIIYTENIYTD